MSKLPELENTASANAVFRSAAHSPGRNRSTRQRWAFAVCAQAAALALSGAMAPPAMAASCTWNPATGNWSIAGNWSCGTVPTGGPDTAIIAGGKVVTVNTTQSILNLTNAGGVNIDAFLLTLAGGGSTTNTGIINVGAGPIPNNAALQVGAGHNITNTGGVINVSADSVLNQFGSTITGGTINTTGTGALVAFNSGSNFLSGVTLNGTLDLATGTGIERVSSGLTLNGAINVNSNSILSFEGNQTLAGIGTITLGNTGGSNRIGIDNTGVLTVGANILIHGQNGTIGGQPFVGGPSTLNNGGTISADVSGGSISLVANTTNNTGTLSAANGGQLVLNGPVTNTGSGHIDATGVGSNVLQNGVTVTGGTLNTSSGGRFAASNNGANVLSGVTLNGTLDLATATGIEHVTNGLTLVSGSTININNNSVLALDGSQSVGGTGTIVLGSTGGSNRIGLDGAGTTTLGANVVIRGENGTVGAGVFVGGAHDLINNGRISADVALGAITLNPSAGTTNNGILEAQNGGTLLLNSNVIGNAGSQIRSGAGSTVLQNGVTLSGVINTSGSGRFAASNSGANILSGVTLSGTLDLATATAIEHVIGGLTLNSATININSNSVLALDGSQSVGGTGTIVLGSTGGSNRIGLDGAGTTTLGANVVIRGENGTVGAGVFVGGVHDLINNGRVSADVAGGAITLNPNAGTTNNGILEAQNGGTLLLNSNVIGNAGSQIRSGAGSTVLQNGVTLSGVINTSGSGRFAASNSGANVLSGVTLGGTLDLATATGIEHVTNGLTLNGAININNNSILALDGTQSLGGTGTIVLGSTGGSNRIGLDGAGTTTLGANVVIRGENGTVGAGVFVGGAHDLINNGRISADVALGAITLNPSAGTTNNGILEAQNGGTLLLNSNVIGNAGSQIRSGAGSTVLQNGVTLSGVINTSGSGRFAASNSGANILSGVTLSGTLDLATATAIEHVIGGLTLNSATININSNSVLALDGSQSVGGTGTIVLGSTGGSNRIGLDGAGTTTLGANVVIRGENGTVGAGVFVGGAHDLINNGRISADVSGGLIALNPSGGTTNAATLEALNGGTLRLDTAVTASGSGHIDATGAGSRVVQNGATITGGTINTTGGGVLAPTNNGNNFLNGVMVNGTIDLATATAIERIGGGTTINTSGAFNINSNSILSFQGTQSIGTTGIGNIVLGDTGSSNRIAIEGGTTLTVDAGVIIHGQNGTIGSQVFAGGAADLINNGTIATDVNGGLITIAPNGSLTNSGTLRAANGGTLTVSPAIAFTNLVGTTLAGGTYEVIAGGGTSNLRLPNANIIANAATILLDGANSNLLNNNTSGDALANLATNATTTTPGSFTIQNGRNFTTAGAFANNALGVVTIGNSSTFNSTGAFSNGGKLAMRGGAFNAPSLLSSAEVNGNGTVNPTIQNTGAVRAFGGTLTATNGVTGTSGTVQSDAGGTLAIGAVSTAGILTNNGNLALGANTVTVSNAYNNANFGAGNSFNNRANVTGAGQILAAGATPGTAQTLSGNIVPTPTSGNATMNFGNIHVGSSSTLNYQIGNVNIGGPSLLGAIQTSVNGGNITDTRLSGAGVTAANWGSVAAGGNTGNLGVTFNATSGGTLTGQQVHIRNNFDNTNAQNLIITGAAFNLASGNATPAPIVFANAHVGDTRTQVLTVGNTAPASAFTEGLNASFGVNAGNVSNNAGSINLLAGGATNNSAMSVTLDTTAAGARSGTATLNYASDGSGTSGLGQTAAGSQVVTVSGNVYRLASANALAAINFGNVHVNDAVQQALNITNTAVADSFSEKLNASFGASSDARITTNGSINQLAAGSSNNSSMVVGLNTVAAGTVNGTQVVNFASDGAGTSGLGITALTSQTIGVSGNITTVGNVFRLASASAATPNPVNFGNVRIGTVTDQALSITNTAANDGFSEKLNASITTNGAPVTASGAFNLLGPTATDNSSLHVGLNTGSAGAKSGSATIALVSDGAGTSNLGTTALTAQTVNVSGAVYRLASPTLNTPSVNLVARVGDAAPSANVSISNSSPDVFTEGLKASIGGTSAPFTSSGAVANLAAQGTAASSLQVGLNTATAGTSAGIATVNFSSTGAGTTGAADVSVGSAIVNLAGKVYQQAVAQVNTTLVNFGIVHVGDTVSPQAVSVTNAAPVAALNDVLQGDLSPISGPFSTTGTLGAGLAAGANDNSSLKVALNTATAGIYSGTTTARLVSHDADQADLVINGIPVALSAQVNNFANADIAKSGGAGTLSRSGNNVVLDFGQVQQGGTLSTMLSVLNNVLGPADLLSGFFDLTGANNFLFSGFNPFSDLAAGSSQGGYGIGFNRSSLGSFSDTILLSAIGSNASGYSDTSRTRLTLQIRGNVVAGTVPEPGTLFLLPLGLLLILLGRRRHLAI